MGLRRDHHRFSKQVTRTKRWKALRAEILERDSYRCRSCGCGGRLEVDHIQPVRTHPELSYDPANLQALCPSCHTRKTRIECGHKPARVDMRDWQAAVSQLEGKRPTWSIPRNLRPSRIPVTIVTGPPGAGKSTYVGDQAQAGDVIIDFDLCLQAVGGRAWDTDRATVQAAFKLRNEQIRSLADARRGRAWLIVGAPSAAERKEWARQLLRVELVILNVDPGICKARILADPNRQHAAQKMCAAVDDWWSSYAADGGKPQTKGAV